LAEAILRRVKALENPHTPSPEIIPPAPAPVVVRKANRPVIDGESAQHECNIEKKAEQFQQVAYGYADTRDSPPQPERANVEPTATEMVPTRGMNGRIRWIPR
jgi:hypothetical protein